MGIDGKGRINLSLRLKRPPTVAGFLAALTTIFAITSGGLGNYCLGAGRRVGGIGGSFRYRRTLSCLRTECVVYHTDSFEEGIAS